MRIKEILWQNRRDFKAVYECEHCGYSEKVQGTMMIIFTER